MLAAGIDSHIKIGIDTTIYNVQYYLSFVFN